ncbi:hypothetical protein [Glutamicibacter sp. AOP5-A2-18]|uniref:hypothetical protein n=1 Tax=Glutamicibacter sp. AOP5-A2-18 TaxID=3457656 RepID=UPI004033E624
MENLAPEAIALGAQLARIGATNGATAVTDKIKALRSGKKQDQIIAGLEELISELVDEKAELLRIAQSYRQELTSQELSAGDVHYIVNSVVPLIEELVPESGDSEETQAMIDKIKPILSVQTINILQLLGFNFRRAVGEPLTDLVANLISKPLKQSEAVTMKRFEMDKIASDLAKNPEAFERFKQIRGINAE